jgi:hypothetical protein
MTLKFALAPSNPDDILYTQAGTPTLDLRFASSKSLVDHISGQNLITFTRSSNATFFDANGTIQTAGANTPRFDHNPATGESLGLLIEEARTNLLLNSETLATQSVTVTAAAHTLSFYGTGTVTLSGTHSATVVGTGAFPTRTTLTFTPTSGSLTVTVSGTVQYGQVELGGFATSWISTAGATATRNADAASITGTNFSRWYSQGAGTVFADARTQQSASGHVLAGVSTGSFASSAYLVKSNDNVLRAAPAASPSNLNITLQSVTSNVALRSALAFTAGTGSASAVMNGGTVGTAGSTGIPITMSQMGIGCAPWSIGATLWNGHIRRLAYFDRRLPNATLQAITSSTPPTVYGNLKLDNGTRAAAIAGVSPTLDYRFAREKREIETVSLTDKLTYTGGNGTFVGSDGFIQRAITNVPRFDHDPLNRRSLGLLSEVERTNLLVRSEEFDNASWTKSNASITANSVVAPSGLVTGDKLIENTASSTHLCTQNTTLTANTAYALSIFAKVQERTQVAIQTSAVGNWANSVFTSFDLSLGIVISGTGVISLAGNGWYRCSINSTFGPANASGGINVFLINNGFSSYTGDGTSGLYLWGAQLEAASAPSTYIPTTSAAVTRTADSAVIDGTGVITGTYTLVEKPAGCAVVSGTNINLQPGFTAERVMVFPAALDAGQITAIRGAM